MACSYPRAGPQEATFEQGWCMETRGLRLVAGLPLEALPLHFMQ